MNERPSHFDPADRRNIEDEIERLIGLLDSADADPEEEPSLGWTESGPQAVTCGASISYGRWDGANLLLTPGDGRIEDREDDVSDYEPDDDGAPSLGAPENHPEPGPGPTCGLRRERDGNQAGWSMGTMAVFEDEPALAWCENAGMGIAAGEPFDDAEDACEDEGADIQAQPHDDEGDAEPNLGRLETVDQSAASYGGRGEDEGPSPAFTGEGHKIGKALLLGPRSGLPMGRYVETSERLPDDTIIRRFEPETSDQDPCAGDWRRAHYMAALHAATSNGAKR